MVRRTVFICNRSEGQHHSRFRARSSLVHCHGSRPASGDAWKSFIQICRWHLSGGSCYYHKFVSGWNSTYRGLGVGKQSTAKLHIVKDYILCARKMWPVDTSAVTVYEHWESVAWKFWALLLTIEWLLPITYVPCCHHSIVYAFRVLCSHGIQAASLHDVYSLWW